MLPWRGELNPTCIFPQQLLFYINVNKRSLCLCVSGMDGAPSTKIKYKKEMSNTAQDRIFLLHKLTLEELHEWTEPWLVCLFLFVFFFHPFCISVSICFFFCLSLCPFVLKQFCGCAYIICNPAGRWEQERDGKKPFPLPINYYSLCPFFCSLLYCFAASLTAMVTCLQNWEEGENDTDEQEQLRLRVSGYRGKFELKYKEEE